MFLSKSVMEVTDLPLIAVDLVVLDIAKIVCDVEFFGKGLAEIPMDVVNSRRPCMVQLRFKPIRVSAKLAHAGTDKQVFQISRTLVAFVLVAQHDKVGHGNKFPRGACFVLAK